MCNTFLIQKLFSGILNKNLKKQMIQNIGFILYVFNCTSGVVQFSYSFDNVSKSVFLLHDASSNHESLSKLEPIPYE